MLSRNYKQKIPNGWFLIAWLLLSFPLQLFVFIQSDPSLTFFLFSAQFISLSVLRWSPQPLRNTEHLGPSLPSSSSSPKAVHYLKTCLHSPLSENIFPLPRPNHEDLSLERRMQRALLFIHFSTFLTSPVKVFPFCWRRKTWIGIEGQSVWVKFHAFFWLKYTPEGLSGRQGP